MSVEAVKGWGGISKTWGVEWQMSKLFRKIPSKKEKDTEVRQRNKQNCGTGERD